MNAEMLGCNDEYFMKIFNLLPNAIKLFINFSKYKTAKLVVNSLSELQRLAYQPSEKRCSRDALRAHLLALKFSQAYLTLFCHPAKLTKRRIFGAPFHSIVSHLAELYELVAPSQLNAEAEERIFSEMR